MCGRFALSDTQQLSLRFDVMKGDEHALIPRYNIAPTQTIPVIVEGESGRVIRMMRWGFRPPWKQKDGKTPDPINARAETLLDRPMFRASVARKRCLIPADGFYEWKVQPGSTAKQPYFIRLKDHSLFAFAGLYAEAQNDDGLAVPTCAIVTTSPNRLMSEIHNRMPAILERPAEGAWLDRDLVEADVAVSFLKPYDDDEMAAYPVSSRVSSPRNDGPELIEPLDGR
jgi:putative SOS response-associated peptidase YedK